MSILALDKWARLMRMISQAGGIRGALWKLWRHDTLKEGRLVGWDSFNNKYYENNMYFLGRNRWVEYAEEVKWDYEGSQIPAEWFGWIHHRTDRLPCDDIKKRQCYPWLAPHTDNLSGTPCAYYPYSTVPARLGVWDGNFT
ncbi:probable NADH dehydrogenase [ubiquinone] 1 alpha subcomplex subunit 12 [Pectinophora gossypiella]|uniref:probable NADH dehydrogenase [ubiquinone] 1 alpha subcomplex subunit 12 n=1 Tax=Pectinophora gossypiella TaxID=13191 RepID=UPI00214F06EE|nr:probable NADH dehydrogenase [ubiquinone] 1 alpha subcomplex subunit 12 [Pectinophora gossypiella]